MEAEAVSGQITRRDQWSYIKIESLRGKNSTEIHNNLREVCGDNVVDHSTVSRWSARFREGQLSTEDKPRSGRPSTATDYTSEVIVNDILRKTCEEIAHEARMSVASVYRIITNNLKMRKVVTRWVPHHLSDEQKAYRQRIAEELLHRYQTQGEEFTKFWLVSQIEENTPRKTFCYNWRSFHWSDPSDQTAQQWRCYIRNKGFTKILGSCHKEEWGLYWRPVKGFCKMNNCVQYNKSSELLK